MKIVVTGALGHIGSRLIRELPGWFGGSQIVLIDDMSAQRYCSLFNLPNGNYRFLEGDVIKMDLESIFKGVDFVFHLAAITNAAASFEIAAELERVNFSATSLVAEACLKSGASLIYLSTTSVYGTQAEVVDENCALSDLKQQSPYAETKLKEERLLQELGSRGLRFIICRFGTIFGVSPGMRFHTAVNKFCWQAVLGQPLTVWRTALHQKRPYLDLNDAMAVFKLITARKIFDGRIYNVLTANLTVNDIVEDLKEHIPDVNIKLVDQKIMNQLSYEILDARFRAHGFKPQGSLRQGVADTVKLLKGSRLAAEALP